MANATIKTYGVTELPESNDVPDGMERISLVQDPEDGYTFYQVEKDDGTFYLCDADGDVVTTVSEWILLRVLADIPADDSDAFFTAIEATAIDTESSAS